VYVISVLGRRKHFLAKTRNYEGRNKDNFFKAFKLILDGLEHFAVCYGKNGFAEVSQNLDIDLKIILLDQNNYVEALIIMLQNVLIY